MPLAALQAAGSLLAPITSPSLACVLPCLQFHLTLPLHHRFLCPQQAGGASNKGRGGAQGGGGCGASCRQGAAQAQAAWVEGGAHQHPAHSGAQGTSEVLHHRCLGGRYTWAVHGSMLPARCSLLTGGAVQASLPWQNSLGRDLVKSTSGCSRPCFLGASPSHLYLGPHQPLTCAPACPHLPPTCLPARLLQTRSLRTSRTGSEWSLSSAWARPGSSRSGPSRCVCVCVCVWPHGIGTRGKGQHLASRSAFCSPGHCLCSHIRSIPCLAPARSPKSSPSRHACSP